MKKRIEIFILLILIGATLWKLNLVLNSLILEVLTIIYFSLLIPLCVVVCFIARNERINSKQEKYNDYIEEQWKILEQKELKNVDNTNDVEKYFKVFKKIMENSSNNFGCAYSSLYQFWYKFHYISKVLNPLLERHGLEHFAVGIYESDYALGNFEQYENYYSYNKLTEKLNDDISFSFSHVTTKDKDDETKIFDGTVVFVQLQKSINCEIDIIPQKSIKEKNFIAVDNEEFEEKFDVYSLDEIKALRFLTPDVMMKILDLKSSSNLKFEIKIINNNVFVRFYNCNLVILSAPSLFNDFDADYKSLIKYFNIIEKIENIIEIMIKEMDNFID